MRCGSRSLNGVDETGGALSGKNKVRIRANAVHLRISARGKRAAPPASPEPTFGPTSVLGSGWVRSCPDPPRQHAAAGLAARLLPHEICRSIAARTADCERGSASEDSPSCSRHPPPKVPRGRARGTAARYTAAHPARHSYTADRLAGTPRAQPPLGSDAWGSISGSALTGFRGWMDLESKAQACADRAR